MIEEKVQLDENIAKATKEFKNLVVIIELSKKEKTVLDLKIEDNKKIILEQSKILQDTLNDISGQKVTWLQDKASQEREIEGKKSECDLILNRISEIEKRELEISEDVETAKIARDETRQNLFKIEQEKIVIESIKKEIENKENIVNEKLKMIERKIISFKDTVHAKIIIELANL